MSRVIGKPYPGPFVFNLENVAADLIDLNDGALKGLRGEQEGLPGMLEELARSVPALGEAAGIPIRVYDRIVQNTDKIDRLAEHERRLDKGREVVHESRRKYEHDREHDIGLIVDVVKSVAQRTGDASLLAAFQKTIEYKNQIAAKAAQTRRKNEQAADQGEGPAGDENA